jgi:phytoene dehydrogenase-like protein
MQPLTGRGTAAFALVLQMLGHGVGWPVAAGGSRGITDAMASLLVSLGGEIETGRRVSSLAELEPSRAVLLDTSPRDLLAIAGPDLPRRYRRVLGRYRYGPGVFKVDYALSAPVPWTAAACRSAGTVHVGGTLAEIAEAEAEVAAGRHPRRPFVLVAQQSLFDDSRAPQGCHTLWAYCHVPNGSAIDMTDAIERQIERFAPGFAETVMARHRSGRRRPRRRIRTTLAAISTAERPISASCWRGRWCAGRTRRRTRGCSSAPPRRRPAGASTACAAGTRPGRRCAARFAERDRKDV